MNHADYLYPLAPAELPALKAIGPTMVGRYTKNLTKAEVLVLHSAGLGVNAIYENDNGAGGLGGAPMGAADGQTCRSELTALGYPTSADVVVVFQDRGMSIIDLPALVAYCKAFRTALGWGGKLYGYGGNILGYRLVAAGVIDGVWEAGASSWSGPRDSRTVAVQHLSQNSPAPFTGRIDLNDVFVNLNVWSPSVMAYLIRDDRTGEIDITDGVTRRHLDLDGYNFWKSLLGKDFVSVPATVWDAWPVYVPPPVHLALSTVGTLS